MKLWILRPVVEWEWTYDKVCGIVVRAETEGVARCIAMEEGGDECEEDEVWLNPKKTECRELTACGEAGAIIVDFHNG